MPPMLQRTGSGGGHQHVDGVPAGSILAMQAGSGIPSSRAPGEHNKQQQQQQPQQQRRLGPARSMQLSVAIPASTGTSGGACGASPGSPAISASRADSGRLSTARSLLSPNALESPSGGVGGGGLTPPWSPNTGALAAHTAAASSPVAPLSPSVVAIHAPRLQAPSYSRARNTPSPGPRLLSASSQLGSPQPGSPASGTPRMPSSGHGPPSRQLSTRCSSSSLAAATVDAAMAMLRQDAAAAATATATAAAGGVAPRVSAKDGAASLVGVKAASWFLPEAHPVGDGASDGSTQSSTTHSTTAAAADKRMADHARPAAADDASNSTLRVRRRSSGLSVTSNSGSVSSCRAPAPQLRGGEKHKLAAAGTVPSAFARAGRALPRAS